MTTWKDIQGQTVAIDWLRPAYVADRLPHGLIFAGPVGVGKGMTAQALAGLFLCEKPKHDQPCGSCASCVVLAAGNHPDYHSIYRQLVRLQFPDRKAIDLSIDVVRPYLIEPAGRKAAMNRGKVFVVEEADLMSVAAQNALLKTLEEPAGRTLLVLLTDQPDSLLPTIRSRCQIVRFAPLNGELVATELQKRGVAPADARDAADFAAGSLGLAVRWLGDGVVQQARQLRAQIDTVLAGGRADDLPDWFRAAADAYAARQLEQDELASKEQATRSALLLYLRIFAQLLSRRLPQTARGEELERLCAAIEAVGRAADLLESNVNVGLIFQQFAVTLDEISAAAAVK